MKNLKQKGVGDAEVSKYQCDSCGVWNKKDLLNRYKTKGNSIRRIREGYNKAEPIMCPDCHISMRPIFFCPECEKGEITVTEQLHEISGYNHPIFVCSNCEERIKPIRLVKKKHLQKDAVAEALVDIIHDKGGWLSLDELEKETRFSKSIIARCFSRIKSQGEIEEKNQRFRRKDSDE